MCIITLQNPYETSHVYLGKKQTHQFFSMSCVSIFRTLVASTPSPTPQAVHFFSEKKRWCLDNHEETPEGKVLTVFKQPTGFRKKWFQVLLRTLLNLRIFRVQESRTSKTTKKTTLNTQNQILRKFCCELFVSSPSVHQLFGPLSPQGVSYVKSYFSAFS